MSDGYTGVALIGSPASGTEELGSILESTGFFPVDRSPSLRLHVADETEIGAISFDLTEWAETLVDQCTGPEGVPPSHVLRERIPTTDLRLAFSDARECAQGAPLLVSDTRLVPLLGTWLDDPGTDFLPVLVLRNPIGVARSLAKRWSAPIHEGLAAWEYYASFICGALGGRHIMAVHAESLAKSEMRLDELLLDVESKLSTDVGATIDRSAAFLGPALAGITFETDEELEEYATAHQVRLWHRLCNLIDSPSAEPFPAEFQSPSDAAIDSLHFGAQRKRQQEQGSERAVKLAELYDDFTLVYARQEELEAALHASHAATAQGDLERQQLVIERDQFRRNAEELLHRVRSLSHTQSEARSAIDTLSSELETLRDTNASLAAHAIELQQAHDQLRQTETWMVGHLVLTPLRILKSMVRTLRHRRRQ